MSRTVKWGVIGSGGIARRRTIPEGIEPADNAALAAVYDVDAGINEAVAQEYRAAAATSVEELLGAGIEAVYIASPVNAHYRQALASVAAGKHVLCEKPLGMTVAEAEEIVDAARRAGVLFGAAFMMRFHSQHEAARRLAEEGKLGKLAYGRAQLSCWYPPIPGAWRQDPALGGGGSLIDMGCHCIDLLETIFGPVRKVSCFANNCVQAYASEDNAVAMLFFAGGALGTVDALYCIPDESGKNRLEVYGSLGSVLAEGTIGQGSRGRMMAYLQQAPAGYQAQQSWKPSDGIEIAPEPVNTYRAEIEEFSQAILNGRQPRVSGDAGVWSQKVMAACYESARTGTVIEVRQ